MLKAHDFLIAKLHAYGNDIDSLNIPQDYLSNRKKRTKLDSFYSSWEAIPSRATPSGVPPGSILGPLLFNIFMCDNFLILTTTILLVMQIITHHLWLKITDVIKASEEIGESFVNWFSNNEMQLNTNKCHLLLNTQEPNTLKIGNSHINL